MTQAVFGFDITLNHAFYDLKGTRELLKLSKDSLLTFRQLVINTDTHKLDYFISGFFDVFLGLLSSTD
jgi:hypothetical protein